MCGIAGILSLSGQPPDQALLRGMNGRLAHRGPDDEGYHFNGRLALAQRRLSIIDLQTGQQPLANEDGTVWVTFNGEIYNFQELRRRLEAQGHRFQTASDTEVIVHAYEQHGPDCVQHFRGMFAFAVWDARQQTLFLARDRVGKKPLYYAWVGGSLLFASELQALLSHSGLRREVDPAAVDAYLTYGYIPAPRTIFRDVFKLPPAHHLTVRGTDRPRPECYWQLEYGPKLELSEPAAAEQFLDLLREAVRLRMIADVPLGALLSGGIDSSLVVALMSQASSQPVRTFSIGFAEEEFNELPYARLVARQYGTEHHELMVRPSALDILPMLVRHYGEPFADSSAIPSYHVARLTRQHVKVALNGDGGDECFAGYERYRGMALAEYYQKIPGRNLIGYLGTLLPESLPRRSRLGQAKRFLQAANLPRESRYLRWVSYFTSEHKQRLYSAAFRAELAGQYAEDWLAQQFQEANRPGLDPLDHVLAVDVRSYLPYDLLVKMDIATMACSLEARSPFLDHHVMEFAARLPTSLKLRRTSLKHLLKRVAGQLLPPQTYQRRKMGFGVPVGDWMRGELRPLIEDTLLSSQSRSGRYFDPQAVRELARSHLDGRRDASYQLWALLWLELWHREFGS